VDRSNPREAVSSIEYSVNLLRNTNRCLWIFPEGEMNVQDHVPIKFYSGISKIADKTGSVILMPVAFRYEFIDEQRPEIFIQIGKGDVIESNTINTKDLTEYLCNKLKYETALLRDLVKNKQLDGFKVIFRGKESRNKTVERLTV
jgi:1-acyl-sn-glycerol-3-phosphate acyltransferase